MYYEFYPDVYFLESLILNFLVLHLSKQIERAHASNRRLLLAGSAGAFASCVMMLLPIHRNMAAAALVSLLLVPVMAWLAFKRTGDRNWRHMIFTICMTAFLLGGIWQVLVARAGFSFAPAVLTGYLLAEGALRLWKRRKCRAQYLYDVTLQRGTCSLQLKGLLDSGNRLVQPVTARPVHIIDYEEIQKILSEEEKKELCCLLDMETCDSVSREFTYIPYRSIGNQGGVLPAILLDGMEIKHGESAWSTKRVLVAVSKRAVSERGEYQMILHPHILE